MVAHPFNKQALRFSCQRCSLKQLCFPVGLTADEISKLDMAISDQIVLKRRETLFKQGSAFKGFFVVRSGAFKYVYTAPSEEPRILAFYMPGDFFGLDAMHSDKHPATAEALEDSSICIISFEELMNLTREVPKLQHYLMDVVSQKCSSDIDKLQHHHTAAQRLAKFLLLLSAQFKNRGYSAQAFQLPMPRKDIANYLDLASETISRLFKTLQDNKIITLSGKLVTINHFDQLQRWAEVAAE